MKRILAALLSLSLLLGMLAMNVLAEDVVFSGKCGDALTWELQNNALTISGTGDMYDYSDSNRAPWNEYRLEVNSLIIEEGVTGIGAYSCVSLSRLTAVYLPKSLKKIGSRGFSNSSSNYYFHGGVVDIADDAFAGTRGFMHTLSGWEESDRKLYGGALTWLQGEVVVSAQSPKLFELNQVMSPEDFSFCVYYAEDDSIPYTPESVRIGQYDNSSFGQKTVDFTVDGMTVNYTYYVTDGNDHLNLIRVEHEKVNYYTANGVYPTPVVTAGTETLVMGTDYTVTYENAKSVGKATMTVTGIGLFDGYQESFDYAILKRNISDAAVNVSAADFIGYRVIPEVTVSLDGRKLKEGTDYSCVYKDNVNIGTGTVKIIGKGSYYGVVEKTFQVKNGTTTIDLSGKYNGNASGELNNEVYYAEGIVSPGQVTCTIGTALYHVAYYTLYRVDGENVTEITTLETSYDKYDRTKFTYDFSFVYEDAAAEGGQVYLLTYTWIDSSYDVHSGAYAMLIPAKVANATALSMEQSTDENFRTQLCSAYGQDGAIGELAWTSSDTSVADVNDGEVRFHKPGTVTIKADWNGLSVSTVLNASVQDFTKAEIISWDMQTRKASVIYAGFLLQEGTDYKVSVSSDNGLTEVTFTGCGLFYGDLVQQYDLAGNIIGHTHSFAHSCSSTCSQCDYTRITAHSFEEQWSKDRLGHWYACAVCGEKSEYAEHDRSGADPMICNICGIIGIPGDIDFSMTVTSDDVVQLLLHISMPDMFPIAVDADFTGDGAVTSEDVVQLLLHISMPDLFPL